MSEAEDKEAIRELMAAYCYALDDYRLADLAALFTADGVWHGTSGVGTGPAGIEAELRRVAPNPAGGTVQRHLITTIAIKVDGDTATARSYYMVVRANDTDPAIHFVGTYTDTLARTPQGWRFTYRALASDMAKKP